MSIKWVLGADPEIFLEDDTNHLFNAYYGFGRAVKGTKEEPEPTDYGGIQIDGMAVEFNTNPTTNVDEFVDLIGRGVDDVRKRYPQQTVVTKSVEHFSDDWLRMQPEASRELGCDPDFSAYTGRVNKTPNPATSMRTAGGHIHIGWGEGFSTTDSQHIAMCREAIIQLDTILYPWSTQKDKEGQERVRLYGKAGSFRPKPYGVEYRSLSNFWVFDPLLTKEVAEISLSAMDALMDGVRLSNTRNVEDNLNLLQKYTEIRNAA